jgi:hypothetical protein
MVGVSVSLSAASWRRRDGSVQLSGQGLQLGLSDERVGLVVGHVAVPFWSSRLAVPDTCHTAGIRGDRHPNFHEARDNLSFAAADAHRAGRGSRRGAGRHIAAMSDVTDEPAGSVHPCAEGRESAD